MLFNDLYDGQTIDARRYSDAWFKAASPTTLGPACTPSSST